MIKLPQAGGGRKASWSLLCFHRTRPTRTNLKEAQAPRRPPGAGHWACSLLVVVRGRSLTLTALMHWTKPCCLCCSPTARRSLTPPSCRARESQVGDEPVTQGQPCIQPGPEWSLSWDHTGCNAQPLPQSHKVVGTTVTPI